MYKKKTTFNRRHMKHYKLNWQLMILIETVKSVSKDAIELTRHSKSTDWICITGGIKNAKIIFIRHCFDRPFCPWYFRLDALVFGSSVLMNFKCMVWHRMKLHFKSLYSICHALFNRYPLRCTVYTTVYGATI